MPVCRRTFGLALAAALSAAGGVVGQSPPVTPAFLSPPVAKDPAATLRPADPTPAVIADPPASLPNEPPIFYRSPQPLGPPPANFSSSACNFNVWCGDNVFSPDYRSCQVLFGGYANSRLGPIIPDFRYLPVTVRRGMMLTAPQDTTEFWRGNWEFLWDFTAAAIISDYGTAFAGPSALIRYNFVRPEARLVPYLQGGVGFIINDAYLDRTQRAIGEAFEFYLHIEMGARYFVAPNWSVDIEGGLQHISNGTLAPRNLGANSLGVTVGFTYYFPSGGR